MFTLEKKKNTLPILCDLFDMVNNRPFQKRANRDLQLGD